MSAIRLKLNMDEWNCCELEFNISCPSWLHPDRLYSSSSQLCYCQLSLHVCLLGIQFMSYISVDSFLLLPTLSTMRHDAESAATLMHAFATTCFDYGNTVLDKSPKTTTDKLQCRAPSRSRKPLQLAYDSLRLASQLAVVSTAAA